MQFGELFLVKGVKKCCCSDSMVAEITDKDVNGLVEYYFFDF